MAFIASLLPNKKGYLKATEQILKINKKIV